MIVSASSRAATDGGSLAAAGARPPGARVGTPATRPSAVRAVAGRAVGVGREQGGHERWVTASGLAEDGPDRVHVGGGGGGAPVAQLGCEVLRTAGAGRFAGRSAAPRANAAMPKSTIRTAVGAPASPSTRTFSGFRSPWTMPCTVDCLETRGAPAR